MRSLLSLASSDRAALACGADALILDVTGPVEESVAVAARMSLHDGPRPRILVRLGPLADQAITQHLELAMQARPFAVMAPGLAGRADLDRLAAKLAVAEARAGILDGSTRIVAVADTARGVLGLATLAGSPRLAGVTWDRAGLSAELGTGRNDAPGDLGDPRQLARALTVLAAAAADVPPIDTPYLALEDHAGLAETCRAARRAGFQAKIAIHSGQVAAINAAFGAA